MTACFRSFCWMRHCCSQTVDRMTRSTWILNYLKLPSDILNYAVIQAAKAIKHTYRDYPMIQWSRYWAAVKRNSPILLRRGGWGLGKPLLMWYENRIVLNWLENEFCVSEGDSGGVKLIKALFGRFICIPGQLHRYNIFVYLREKWYKITFQVHQLILRGKLLFNVASHQAPTRAARPGSHFISFVGPLWAASCKEQSSHQTAVSSQHALLQYSTTKYPIKSSKKNVKRHQIT